MEAKMPDVHADLESTTTRASSPHGNPSLFPVICMPRWVLIVSIALTSACQDPPLDCTRGEDGQRDGVSDFSVIEMDLLSTYDNGDHPTRPMGTEPYIGAGTTISFEVPSCGSVVDDLSPGVTLAFSNVRLVDHAVGGVCGIYTGDLPEAYSLGVPQDGTPSSAVPSEGTLRAGYRLELAPGCEVIWVVAAVGWPDPPERRSDFYPELFAPATVNTVPPVVVFRTIQFFGEDCESVFGAETNAIGQCGDGWAAEARGAVRR